MIPENELLFACCRKNFSIDHHGKAIKNICQSNIDFEVIYLTARRHQVLPLIDYNLSKIMGVYSNIPDRIKTTYQAKIAAEKTIKIQQEKSIYYLLSYFNQKSVEVMLVKGAALSFTVYQNMPNYVLGDIDVILKNKREDVTEQEDRDDVIFFNKLNICEWERFKHHDISINEMLPIDFKKIFDTSINTKFKGENVLVMNPEDMLLAACINSCRKRFFRLKSLLDIAEIINEYPQINWDKFIHDSMDYQCNEIVYTSLLVTHLTVGCCLPQGLLENLGVSPVKAKIIRYLVQYICNKIPLASLLPFSGSTIFGKSVNPSLILVLASYNATKISNRIYFQLKK